MTRSESAKLSKARKLTALADKLQTHLANVESALANVLPPRLLDKLLRQGDISGDAYIETLLSQGHTATEAATSYALATNGPGGGAIAPANLAAIASSVSGPGARRRAGRPRIATTATAQATQPGALTSTAVDAAHTIAGVGVSSASAPAGDLGG